MSTSSNIEWTDSTWTPVKGCTRVSKGCDHCYAVGMTHRLDAMSKAPGVPDRTRKAKYAGLTVLNNKGDRHFNGKVVCDEDALLQPLRWPTPRKVFVSSMSDIFHKDVPFEFLDRIFAVMALCPHLTFQVLTKRAARMEEYFASRMNEREWTDNIVHEVERLGKFNRSAFDAAIRFESDGPLKNVWLGTSVEDQEAADERIPHLLKCPAAVKFLSCEPLLGPIDLHDAFYRARNGPTDTYKRRFSFPELAVSWVIVGGESGPGARPCDVAWVRSIVAQCKAAGVACFVKQLGAHPWADDAIAAPLIRQWVRDKLEKRYVTGNGLGSFHLTLRDKKGGDMAEWPEDLRVREFPEVR